jgi:hypothetical protein
LKSDGQTLSKFWRSRINTISQNSQDAKSSEFYCWKRIDDLSTSLTRWFGTQSIGLVIQGSVPNGIQSFTCENDTEKSGKFYIYKNFILKSSFY